MFSIVFREPNLLPGHTAEVPQVDPRVIFEEAKGVGGGGRGGGKSGIDKSAWTGIAKKLFTATAYKTFRNFGL